MAARCWFFLLPLLLVAPRAVASSFRVGVGAEWHQTPTTRGVSGLFFVELPLGRWAAPRRPLTQVPAGFREPPPPHRAETESAPLAPLPNRPRPSVAAVLHLDARAVAKLVEAALRVSQTPREQRHLDDLSSRARLSAALPELTLRAARSNDQSLRWSPVGTDNYDYTQTGGAGLLLEARATWKLDRLAFADEELSVERFRLERDARRDRLLSALFKQLALWQRARLRLQSDDLQPEALLDAELDLSAAEVELDWLTGGLFASLSSRLQNQRPAPPPAPVAPPAPTPVP